MWVCEEERGKGEKSENNSRGQREMNMKLTIYVYFNIFIHCIFLLVCKFKICSMDRGTFLSSPTVSPLLTWNSVGAQ